MSESNLATYRRYTTNYSKSTLSKTKITIHHMAGIMTAKQCVDLFMNKNRSASAQYCIGNDGSIGQSVSESNRAWTSSSSWNDSRAVTIEVSNSSIGGNWPVSQAAYNSLINLCVDICKRNGISNVTYTGDKNGVLTEHRMFAATACPGPTIHQWLVSGQISNDINKQLRGAVNPVVPAEPTTNMSFVRNGIDYSYIFEPTFYNSTYPDLAAAFKGNQTQLFNHFIQNGMAEHRMGKADFNVDVYKANNPDLVKAFGNNIISYYQHYCVIGHTEPRKHC